MRFITLDESLIITNHFKSLITNNNENDNNNQLDYFWKNWLQIFKDYKYYVQILQQNGQKLLIGCLTSSRFDIHTNNYNGLSFQDWLEYVIESNEFRIHLSNNTYIGNSNENYSNIQGNERYEFSTTDNNVFIFAGYRPLLSSLDQFELDAEYDLHYDYPQLLANGAVNLLLPINKLYLTPPRSIFETATALLVDKSNRSSVSTNNSISNSIISDILPHSNTVRDLTIPSTFSTTPITKTTTTTKRKATSPPEISSIPDIASSPYKIPSPCKLTLLLQPAIVNKKRPIEYYYSESTAE